MSKYATTLKDYMTKVGDLMDQLKALGDPNNIEYGTDAYNITSTTISWISTMTSNIRTMPQRS